MGSSRFLQGGGGDATIMTSCKKKIEGRPENHDLKDLATSPRVQGLGFRVLGFRVLGSWGKSLSPNL